MCVAGAYTGSVVALSKGTTGLRSYMSLSCSSSSSSNIHSSGMTEAHCRLRPSRASMVTELAASNDRCVPMA